MKAHLKTKTFTFELEGATQKDLYKLIAQTQEIFSEDSCGLCHGSSLRYVVREVKGNEFPEVWCLTCGAKLAFGFSKQKPGMMFPIRKLDPKGKPCRKTGTAGKHKGWTKWRGKEGEEEATEE